MKNKFDLLKIGVFLIGVSGIILSFIALNFYSMMYKMQQENKQLFYAYCSEKTIIINAREQLQSVEVLNNQSQVVCRFDKIPAGSEELCIVEADGFYVVEAENRKDVVECRPSQIAGETSPQSVID